VAIAGNRARSKARQHAGCRSGVPWPGRGVGWLASRGCRGLIRAGGARSPAVLPGLCPLDRCSRPRGNDGASVGQCRVAIAGKRARTTERQRTGSRSGLPWPGRGVGLPAGIGCRRAPGCRRRGSCWRDSITGSSSGPSPSRSVKPATRRQRRQHRAVPGGRSPASGPSRRRGNAPAADRAFRGLVVVSDCWQAAVAVVWSVLAGLDHRQFFRVFVLSIGEAGHEATTAPVSGGTGWQIASKRAKSKARQRTGCRSGVPWPGQDLGVLERRQYFRVFVLSIGEASHEATTAPASGGTGWQIAGKRAKSKARQRTGCRSGVPWPGRGVGLQAGIGCRRAPGCRRRGSCWRDSITGSSSGPSPSRSVQPATKRRRRQCRAVPGGDRQQAGQDDSETPHRQPIGVAVAWSWCRLAGRHRLQTCARAAAGVAHAGGTRSPAVRPGLLPLDQ
jgi:hypothetical protein